MATFPIPKISPQNYDAFRRILNRDLPDTYDKWLDLHAEEIAGHRRNGNEVREIEVDPDEFTRYLNVNGHAANRKSLQNLTIENAAGNKY